MSMREEWARRLHNFDLTASYSDDRRVWERYLADHKQLVADVAAANLNDNDKTVIMAIVGKRSDELYTEAKARWGDVLANEPLWSAKSNARYVFCAGMLGLGSE